MPLSREINDQTVLDCGPSALDLMTPVIEAAIIRLHILDYELNVKLLYSKTPLVYLVFM